MSRVDYVVRDNANAVQYGALFEEGASSIDVSHSKDVSLNISPAAVKGYKRSGDDLLVIMNNGDTIVLSGYFDDEVAEKHLFLSENGDLNEVILSEGADGAYYPRYDVANVGDKWSPYDDLVFLDVGSIEPVVAPLIAPALGGLGLLGGAAAAVGGAAIIGGIIPNGDDDGPNYDLTVQDTGNGTGPATGGYHILGGTGPDTATIIGTGTPGSTIEVEVGGKTQTTTVDANGN